MISEAVRLVPVVCTWLVVGIKSKGMTGKDARSRVTGARGFSLANLGWEGKVSLRNLLHELLELGP